MEPRRGGRPSQVRPRPPAYGHAPVRVRPVAPSPTRLARYRRIDRRRGLPLPLGALLAVGVLAMGFAVLLIGSGRVGPVVSSMVGGFGGFVNSVGAAVGSAPPTEAPAIADAPTVESPEQPYTNDDTIDVTVNIPAAVVGDQAYSVRLWVTLKDTPAAVLTEVPVGETSVLLIPSIELAKGRNDLQASILGPSGESELSGVATWILDTSKPKLQIISPDDRSSTNKEAITIKGKTQANSTVRLHNEANGATTTVDAADDGLFSAKIAVAAGSNAIVITSTDPAGNPNEVTLTIRKGSGKLTVALTASAYRFKANKLPRNVTLTAVVTGPDGRRVADATALFTVTVPGLEAIVSGEITTGNDGTATFTTSIPAGAMPGGGLATVLVTTDQGTATDRQVLTVQ